MIAKLSFAQRSKIDRVMHPRDTLLSLKFAPADVAKWKRAAKCAQMKLQRWMEIHLRQARAMGLMPSLLRERPKRAKMVAQRFTAEDVQAWRMLATYDVTTTDWVEYVLNIASKGFES